MGRIASRYAKSLIELAVEKNQLEVVNQDMLLFHQVCKENRDFVLMLKNPIITHDRKRTILRAIFKDAHEITLALFDIITRKYREEYLPEVAREFNNQYNMINGIEKASITTTFPLDDPLKDEFKRLIERISHKEADLEEQVDEDIVGGFKLKIGDKLIDESLRSKLNDLSLEFKKNPFKKAF